MEIKSEIFYYDENYKPCNKEDAVVAHIHHMDDDGKMTGETVGYIGGKRPKIPLDFKIKNYVWETTEDE